MNMGFLVLQDRAYSGCDSSDMAAATMIIIE